MPETKSGREDIEIFQSGSRRFLYRSVCEAIRERITNGSYPPNERIPSVRELASDFSVSTITVRHAIRELSLEGLLVGRQGLGVFVRDRRKITRSLRSDRIAPIEEDMRKAGVEPRIHDLNVTLVSSKNEEAAIALSKRYNALHKLERVLLADGEPVGLDTLWLPKAIFRRLGSRIHERFIISQLQEMGTRIDHIDYRLQATTASEKQARRLHIVTGFPLLEISYSLIQQGGAPILAGRTITRADRFCYEFSGRPNTSKNNSNAAARC